MNSDYYYDLASTAITLTFEDWTSIFQTDCGSFNYSITFN